ncbi:MAG TPA: DUF3857 domain-containing protein [Verrucomicrobiae bacterium]|nr:DUF3857 domain-containing protein [Verrucomicrobiae bacterium]
MPNRRAFSISVLLLFAARVEAQDRSTDAGEAFVIEQVSKDVVFQSDGRSQATLSARVRIQSPAGLQTFGVLTFPYRGENESIEVAYVRVRKADESIIATPESSVQDLPAEVARMAPTYSDSREKQIPVKALGVGDTLEYQIRVVTTKPDVPGEFWCVHSFTRSGVVNEETLRITVPSDKYIKVSSPGSIPDISEREGLKVYSWTTSYHPQHKADGKTKLSFATPSRSDVQLTSFRSWADLGHWYASLQEPKVEVNDAIRAKAAELTAGIKTDSDKIRALYNFVSTKFRYISLSFGVGRFAPHSAAEVLANQYGDCKDKHTLLAALLKATGIQAWPVLIGAGINLDPDLPSPAQFNHLITYIPSTDPPTWLDTTPEVAPYGMLLAYLRGKQALLMPDDSEPRLVRTADSTPFPSSEVVSVKSKINAQGTLTGHFDILSRGDTEVVFRSLFHSTAPAQWTELAQNLSAGLGYGGVVSRVDVSNPGDLETAFQYSYQYERKDYSEWADGRITPPLPVIGLSRYDEEEAPAGPTELGTEGSFVYHATIELPPGFKAALPSRAHYAEGPLEYTASYALDSGVISADRSLTLKRHLIEASEWGAYQQFVKEVIKEQGQYIILTAPGGHPTSTNDSQRAVELVKNAWTAIDKRDFKAADENLAKAKALDDHASGLWNAWARLYELEGNRDKAIDILEKLVADPQNDTVLQYLISLLHQAGRSSEEINYRQRVLEANPQDLSMLNGLVAALIATKRYLDAVDPLSAAVSRNPTNTNLQVSLFEVLLYGGKKDQAMQLLTKLRSHGLATGQANSTGYYLIDTGVDVGLGRELVQKSIDGYDDLLKDVKLDTATDNDFRNANSLGAAWDSLGWAAFRLGDLTTAEKFVKAAWNFEQHAVMADHLGQIYERQGKKDQAIHAYRLSLAVNANDTNVKQRLSALGGAGPTAQDLSRLREEVSKLRSIRVKDLTLRTTSTAYFLVLFSNKGLEDLRFDRGDAALRPAVEVLRKLSFPALLPEGSPAKLPRQAVLSCSAVVTPPDCQFTLLLPANFRLY